MRAGLLAWVLHSSIVIICASAARQSDLAKPDYDLYHTKDGILDAVRETAAKCSSIMSVEERYSESDKYNSKMTIVTVEPGGLTKDHANKTRLLVNYGEHGRELISSELALALLHTLCNETALASALFRYDIDIVTVTASLPSTVFKIVPMENVHGRELVENGELCERKNGRGVDPNRNWAVHWGFKEPDYDPKEEYPGTAPFSEPEAALLRALAQEFKPHAWVNVHSGMEALFMPYDHKNTIPEGSAGEETLKLLKDLNTVACHGRCAVGSGGKAVGYLAHGTATDYMHEVLRTPISLTWEVYGDMKASYHDCFRMFNPLDETTFNSVVSDWTAAVFALVTGMKNHSAVVEWGAGKPAVEYNSSSGGGSTTSSSTSVDVKSGIDTSTPSSSESISEDNSADDNEDGSLSSSEQPKEQQHEEDVDVIVDSNEEENLDDSKQQQQKEIEIQQQEQQQQDEDQDLDVLDDDDDDVGDFKATSSQSQQNQQQAQQPTDNQDNNNQADVDDDGIELVIPSRGGGTADGSQNIDDENNDTARDDASSANSAFKNGLLGRKEGFSDKTRLSSSDRGSSNGRIRSDSWSISWIAVVLTVVVATGALHKAKARGGQNYMKVPRRSPSPNSRWRRKRSGGGLLGV